MFQPVSNKSDFPNMEREILAFWEAHGTFKKSVERNKDKRDYVFYDGPPFATGLPHYGHLLAGTIKDIVPRYQTMRGYHVERRFGWDCHGLPIEALAQEALGVNGTHEIRQLGVDKFNEQCRAMVLKYVDEWRKTVTRMGRWVDFDNDYKTMDPAFMESIWWVFKQLWDQGRVYKSYRIMPYSWKLSTPLSNFEAGSNYKDVQDPAVTVRAKVLTGADPAWGETSLLIWTTTPWTLPENLAICAGPEIDYVAVRDVTDNVCFVMAEARVSAYYKKPEEYQVLARMKGADLKGWTYEPIFPYFAEYATAGAFRVLNDAFVSTGDGTGLVHIAPAYGEDDFRVCKEAGLNVIVDPLDASCNFTETLPEYKGRFCKDCDKDLIKRLKHEGKLVHQTTIVHSYPFCDRTDTPLVYRAIEAWYVRVEDLHDRLTRNNDSVHWMPDYVGDKRFGNWLKEARDWNISRNRFWGSCIPVWVNERDAEDTICVGSVAELEALSGVKVTDLHKHFVDKVVIHRDGKTYRRTPEVLDCWFESGAMPYAQQHYPFGEGNVRSEALGVGVDDVSRFFPADFIAEGLDQTRGWFYTLMVLGTCLFDKSPYKNVVVNGLVLAEDGKKMSKRLKNYPDPTHVLDAYGADALRLYMIYSPVVRAENLRFSENGVKQILRDLLIPWWNAYSFFVTYANVDGFHDAELVKPSSPNVLDRWIVSSLETLVHDVAEAMDVYDLQRSVRPFVNFVEDLTNWYIRRSRRRFWKSQNDDDKMQAYRTLRYVLVQLCKVAAPFTPFISEAIYRNLKGASMPESVHLCDFPEADAAARDEALERRMARVQTVVRLGRQLRTENDLKVRQPLSVIHVVSANPEVRAMLEGFEELVTDELNIKSVAYGADETALAEVSVKADFRKLGPKFGPRMKAVATAIAGLSSAQAAALAANREVTLEIAGETVALSAEDVVAQRTPKAGMVVASEGDVIVGLETALTPELVQEGLAREFVSRVQNLRKDADFEVTQRIAVTVDCDAEFRAAVEMFADYVKAETLCEHLTFGLVCDGLCVLNDHDVKIAVARV
ncbi:MAG TPA: isoleucine--tRNA ligase [Kiritimatiellia bacterium]|nr:isoleucine--tRNA ligase [Kiritimatiellia bacterium]HPS08418.1 isoleucine--tRNA ligase [Kiritimatiellia bacterium]